MNKIIENELMTLIFHEEEKIVHHVIHQPVSGARFRGIMLRGCEIFEKYGAQKWLSDDRKNGPISQEDAQWGQEVWNKRVLEAGWKYWALVLPQDLMGTQAMMEISKPFSELGVTVKLFHNPNIAFAWLKKQ